MRCLIAEAATRGSHPAAQLIEARLFDTVLGSLVGLLGGVALHNARIRRFLVPPLRRRIHNRIEFETGARTPPAESRRST